MSRLAFGLWYDFRNPPRWHRDPADLYARILAQIERAEALGWDDVWISEHHFVEDGYTPSTLALAAAIAARTRRIRVGTAVLLLPLHDPVRVAEDAATVDVLSGGRLDLGVGMGYRLGEFEGFGVPLASRVGRLSEGLRILRTLFAGETLDHQGTHYRYRNVTLRPTPVQRPIPVWLGGFVEAAARRAAHYADGLLVSGFDELAIHAYRDELRKLGEDPDAHEIASGAMWLHVSRKPEERWREARDHFRYQLELYARWSEETPGQTLYAPKTLSDDQLRAAGAQVVTPEQAIEVIARAAREKHLSRWYSWTVPPGLPPEWADEHIELMAKEVFPAFR
jgi:alkanesulfonate monooxygenase SsuD/methylene tetrahydromethanopterin reductase-like flavin-dependent oxidoreductase (luciferase family)